jgi:hypothetical protein
LHFGRNKDDENEMRRQRAELFCTAEKLWKILKKLLTLTLDKSARMDSYQDDSKGGVALFDSKCPAINPNGGG